MERDWNGNMKSTFTTLGASNHTDKEREVNDYYATDPVAIDALEGTFGELIPGKVWECACGEGHLSERLKYFGHDVVSTDKICRGYGSVQDFMLSDKMPDGCECIITNPPYKYALEFIEHSLELLPDGGLCIMFLKTTFLEGQKRHERIFKNTPHNTYCSSQRGSCAQRMEISRTPTRKGAQWLTPGMYGEKASVVTRS